MARVQYVLTWVILKQINFVKSFGSFLRLTQFWNSIFGMIQETETRLSENWGMPHSRNTGFTGAYGP